MASTRSLFDEVPPGDRGPATPAEPGVRSPRVFTVVQLTREIRGRMEQLGRISVEGEISRVTRAASGHVYFDLRDVDAKLACTIWRSSVKAAARFELEEGMQVVAHGRLDVYAPRGTYSLNVQRLEQSGIGALLVKFEQQKLELKERGWFDRARPLPSCPKVIGVVTSRDGAAFRDFLRTRSLRWPLYPVRLAHTPVQGPGAALEIAEAVRRLDHSGVDVIVLCRGGGSLEDLWAFNELPVATAIWDASVPVVSGVGHEVDTTLADLVADRRAHTPTDAAQTVIPDRGALTGELERLAAWLAQAMDGALCRRAERLARAASARVLREARWITAERERDLRELTRRLQARSPGRQLESRAARLQRAVTVLPGLLERRLEDRGRKLELASAQLEAFSPLKILGRGYSITTRSGASSPIRAATTLQPGDELSTRLHEGTVISKVIGVEGLAGRESR